MTSVFYLAMFMLYAITGSNLQCDAAAVALDNLDPKCVATLNVIMESFIDNLEKMRLNGSLMGDSSAPRPQPSCGNVSTELSGVDLVMCKCITKASLQLRAARNREQDVLLSFLNALDGDIQFAKSCGFHKDCPTTILTAKDPCLAAANDAMETCAPMVKAAANNQVGDRQCCFALKDMDKQSKICTCSSFSNPNNPIKAKELNNFLHFVNDTTIRNACSLSTELFNGRACGPDDLMDNIAMLHNCVSGAERSMLFCSSGMYKVLLKTGEFVVEEQPLLEPVLGCCLDQDRCRCDPRSISCCQKLGELSKNNMDSCMCKVLKSNIAGASPVGTAIIDFLKFVRNNPNIVNSCRSISSLFTGSCVPPPPPAPYEPTSRYSGEVYTLEDRQRLRLGFRNP